MPSSLVIMGVSGCGKSSLAGRVAESVGAAFVEGDTHHSEANREKMRQGTPLTDADREGWLATLADLLRTAGTAGRPIVLSCSALKRGYRDQLRRSAPGLGFVFMDLDRGEAVRRVTARGSAHFFNAALVDNQFATLERPDGEAGVLRVDATLPLRQLQAEVGAWIATREAAG
jgi:gluconokinase